MKDLKSRFDVLATAAEKVVEHFQHADTAIDRFASELTRSVQQAHEAFSAAAAPARGAGAALAPASGSASMAVSADTSGVQSLAESMATLPAIAAASASQIGPALTAAVRPMMNIGVTMTQQFNQLGGTFTTLARRIDAAMKFPSVDKFIADLGEKAPQAWQKNMLAAVRTANKIYSVWSSLGDVAGKPLAKMARVTFAPVTASASKLSITVKGIGASARAAGAGMASFGRTALASLGVFGLAFAAVDFIRQGIKGASDLTETTNRLNVALGDAAPAAQAFADKMVASFGIAKNEVYQAEAAFGGLGKNLGGLSGQALSDFSNKFTQLSADLASYANFKSTADAAQALQTALSGNQSDRLKELGVVLLDDAVKARAVAEGFAKSTKEVSESAKVQARALMIAEQLRDANGDLANTASSPANMYRRLTGTFQNLAASVGQGLMPIFSKIGGVMLSGLQSVQSLWDRNQESVKALQYAAFSAFETVKTAIGDVWTSLQALPAVFTEVFGGTATGMVSAFGKSIVDNIKAAVSGAGSFLRNMPLYVNIAVMKSMKAFLTLRSYADQIGQWFGRNWTTLLVDAFNFVGRAILDMSTIFARFAASVVKWAASGFKDWKFDAAPMISGFKATTKELPKLIKPDLAALDNEIADNWKKIETKDKAHAEKIKKEVKIANTPPPAAKPQPDEGPKAPEAAEKEKKEKSSSTAGALEFGSKEAASALAKFRNSGAGNETVKLAKRQLDVQQQMLAQLKKAPAKGQPAVAMADINP